MIQEKQIINPTQIAPIKLPRKRKAKKQESPDVHVKIDRLSDYIEARIFQIKSELLKWIIGSSLLQVVANFATNHWGF